MITNRNKNISWEIDEVHHSNSNNKEGGIDNGVIVSGVGEENLRNGVYTATTYGDMEDEQETRCIKAP